MQKITNSSEETKGLAQDFAKKLTGGEIIALFGDLGSGKTTFVQGLARGLCVKERVTSPTFVILNLHKAKKGLKLAHFDLYRISGPEEFEMIGASDYLGKKNIISVIEWPEKVEPQAESAEASRMKHGRIVRVKYRERRRTKKLLPKETIWINFEHIDENKRKITFKNENQRNKS
ncbi:MAG: tRNA (adenosine(37)-N6)-threonylcarbamoyltransferase complex ATPase subunit type 1 TsaE [Candidatus Berkelbacteria bacterium]|nr:tRNA (adenosine(37)-N6)-threonylcarbamoyltransferase complex ATPase subunit type 1 TsaE [Candidatus Berkelbacteria bacterium]